MHNPEDKPPKIEVKQNAHASSNVTMIGQQLVTYVIHHRLLVAAIGLLVMLVVIALVIAFVPQETREGILPEQPTPLAAEAVDAGFVIVVAQFPGVNEATRQQLLWEVASDVVDSITAEETSASHESTDETDDTSSLKPGLVRLPYAITDDAHARQEMENNHAELVIYGFEEAGGILIHYVISPAITAGRITPKLRFLLSASSMEDFDEFLFQGLDGEYIVSFTAGLIYYFNGEWDNAINAFSRAVEALDEARAVDLQGQVAYLYLGLLADDSGDYPAAEAYLTRAIAIDPAFAPAYNHRCNIRRKQADGDNYDAALADCQQALALDPEHASTHNIMGLIELSRSNWEAALAHFTGAIELYTQDWPWPDPYGNRCIAHYRLGDYAAAITDCEAALVISARYLPAYRYLGDSHYAAGDDAAALDAYQAYLDAIELANQGGQAITPSSYVIDRVSELSAPAAQ